MRYKSILDPVLSEIRPKKDERERALREVNAFLSDLNAELKKVNVKAKAVLGGSYAKDTWLSGDYDVDVFVRFDLLHKPQNLSDLLEKALKRWDHERIHGSRDYFWVRNNIKYEIVPVLGIKKPKDAENVTDFSPLHVAWVNTKGKKFKDDIRLVKKFCKGAKCYGAESYIRGFSGHVVDILTIYYKGFIPLLKAAKTWKPKVVLDYNKVYKGNALLMLNKSKIEGPMVLVDPVQPDRNAAAALTTENLDKFIVAARALLAKPSPAQFQEKQIDFEKLAKKGKLVRIAAQTFDDKEDVAGTKFVRASEHVRGKLTDFTVIDAGWLWDRKRDGEWWFLLKTDKLSKEMDWPGPPLRFKDAVKNFKKAHKRTFEKKGRIWAKVIRDATTPKEVLDKVLNGEFVRARVSQTKIIS